MLRMMKLHGIATLFVFVSALYALADGASHTADNVLDFFPETNGDGLNVIWAHGVNSLAELEETLADETMMIETDIILRGIGTENQTNIPVHAHPPDTDSDLTLEYFLNVTTKYPDKGIKLDFKYLEALAPAMELVLKYEAELKTPLWLNADIVIGPNSPRDPIPPVFIDIANSYFSLTTLSLGFTTDWGPLKTEEMYTWQMIFDNLYYSYPLHPQPVTFPIRAIWSISTWPKFVWLLGLRESFSITVWSSTGDTVGVDYTGLVNLREHGDMKRIFYDLPPTQKERFLAALNDSAVTASPPVTPPWAHDQWVGYESTDGRNFAFLSTESLGISGNASRAAMVHTTKEHMPVAGDGMLVTGQVQFIDRYYSTGNAALEIFIRSAGLHDDDKAREQILAGNKDPSGIKFSVSSDGTVEVDGTVFSDQIPAAECYSFSITDQQDGSIDVAFVVKTCSDAAEEDPNAEKNLLSVLTEAIEIDQEYYVIVTKSGGGKDVIVEGLTIEGSQEPTGGGANTLLGGCFGMWTLLILATAANF